MVIWTQEDIVQPDVSREVTVSPLTLAEDPQRWNDLAARFADEIRMTDATRRDMRSGEVLFVPRRDFRGYLALVVPGEAGEAVCVLHRLAQFCRDHHCIDLELVTVRRDVGEALISIFGEHETAVYVCRK